MFSQKGDPYHIAKAMGDRLVLEANRKHGIHTFTIRPTAFYGEGDFQMVEPTIRALEDGVQSLWPGYNDAWMDVVYVGHVSRIQILACKGLLAGLTDPSAPKVDGEAFNVTDDEPAHPLDFFQKYCGSSFPSQVHQSKDGSADIPNRRGFGRRQNTNELSLAYSSHHCHDNGPYC